MTEQYAMLHEDEREDARDVAADNVKYFMQIAAEYVADLEIEDMDRTQFIGLFAQACILEQHLSAIRDELVTANRR